MREGKGKESEGFLVEMFPPKNFNLHARKAAPEWSTTKKKAIELKFE